MGLLRLGSSSSLLGLSRLSCHSSPDFYQNPRRLLQVFISLLSEQLLRSFSWVCRNRLSVARLGMSDASVPIIRTELRILLYFKWWSGTFRDHVIVFLNMAWLFSPGRGSTKDLFTS